MSYAKALEKAASTNFRKNALLLQAGVGALGARGHHRRKLREVGADPDVNSNSATWRGVGGGVVGGIAGALAGAKSRSLPFAMGSSMLGAYGGGRLGGRGITNRTVESHKRREAAKNK